MQTLMKISIQVNILDIPLPITNDTVINCIILLKKHNFLIQLHRKKIINFEAIPKSLMKKGIKGHAN